MNRTVNKKGMNIVAVQSLSCVHLFGTPWTAACQTSLSSTIPPSVLKLMSIELVTPSNHFILCHPLLLLPSVIPSIRVFVKELALYTRWPYYSSFSIRPPNEYPGLISPRTEVWLPCCPRDFKSLLQHHELKASILQCSPFFMVQLSHYDSHHT